MSHSSEERVPQSAESPSTARILPFERPQNELQRAVQQRAQEHLDAASIKPKVSKVRAIVGLAAALVPVLLTFFGFIVAVHAVRIITSLYATPQQSTETPAPVQSDEPPEQRPGVVMIVPDKSITAAPPQTAPAAGSPSEPSAQLPTQEAAPAK